MADTLQRTDENTDLGERVALDHPWITIVWNDPINTQEYVVWVFKSYFGFSQPKAKKHMLQVHNNGKSVLASGVREQMERHVTALHGYGLMATLQKQDE